MAADLALVHHLYVNPGDGLSDWGDLLPFCGTIPGPDPKTGDWHTGHDRDLLLECSATGMVCCSTCLSPEALGGWTPMIIDDDFAGTDDEYEGFEDET